MSCLSRFWSSEAVRVKRKGTRDSPRLPRYFSSIVHVLLGFVEGVEIDDTLVAVILSGPDLSLVGVVSIDVLWILRKDNVRSVIDHDVSGSIPSSEAQVESSHEADGLVDDTHFLVLFSDRVSV